MDDFAVGGLMAFIWQKYRLQVETYGYWGLVAPLLTPPFMLFLNHLGGFSTMDGTVRANIVTYGVATAAATGLFVWALGGKYTGILRYRWMRGLGRISYSFYLIHMTIITLIEPHFAPGSFSSAALAFIACTAYATASWYLMEKHLLRGGKLPSLSTRDVPVKGT